MTTWTPEATGLAGRMGRERGWRWGHDVTRKAERIANASGRNLVIPADVIRASR